MAITAQLAYHYQWQHMYYFVTILLLIAILFVICFFRYARRPMHPAPDSSFHPSAAYTRQTLCQPETTLSA